MDVSDHSGSPQFWIPSHKLRRSDQPGMNMWKLFTNDTCKPTTAPSEPCTLGYYGVYVVKAKTRDHVKAAIDFARANSLRIVIRNTGHDFVGRSVGWGSLIVDTHSFQTAQFTTSYSGPGGYTGPAVKLGAGAQGRETLGKAWAQTPPVSLATGECPVCTPGASGDYSLGTDASLDCRYFRRPCRWWWPRPLGFAKGIW